MKKLNESKTNNQVTFRALPQFAVKAVRTFGQQWTAVLVSTDQQNPHFKPIKPPSDSVDCSDDKIPYYFFERVCS